MLQLRAPHAQGAPSAATSASVASYIACSVAHDESANCGVGYVRCGIDPKSAVEGVKVGGKAVPGPRQARNGVRAGEKPSTAAMNSAVKTRSSGAQGAMEKPQLAVTTVVTP